jgi:hypothetical protein
MISLDDFSGYFLDVAIAVIIIPMFQLQMLLPQLCSQLTEEAMGGVQQHKGIGSLCPAEGHSLRRLDLSQRFHPCTEVGNMMVKPANMGFDFNHPKCGHKSAQDSGFLLNHEE